MSGVELIYFIVLLIVTGISIYEYKIIKRNKKLLIRYEKIRKRLYETNEVISKTYDEEKIYSIVLDTIVDLIPHTTNGSVILLNDEDEKFYIKVVKGFSEDIKNVSFKKEEIFPYKLNGFKETAIINNLGEFNKKYNKEVYNKLINLDALEMSSTIAAPIYIDNKFIGFINADSNIPGHVYTEEDLNLMNQIKVELELAIKNALAKKKLKYLANYDELTGLANRRLLREEFNKEIERIKLNKSKFCIAMIDIDDFKSINDTYGHYYGDLALKHLARILENSIRDIDVASRLAGDEFILLLKEYDYNMAIRKMDSIKDLAEKAKLEKIHVRFSYGLHEINYDEYITFEKALFLADAQMYKNKKGMSS